MSQPIEILLIVAALALYVGIQVLGELGLALVADRSSAAIKGFASWIRDRTGMADPRQSSLARFNARRLESPDPNTRIDAARGMRAYRDRTAVPALIKAVERYRADTLLMREVVRSLAYIGDERNLSVLRELATHEDSDRKWPRA